MASKSTRSSIEAYMFKCRTGLKLQAHRIVLPNPNPLKQKEILEDMSNRWEIKKLRLMTVKRPSKGHTTVRDKSKPGLSMLFIFAITCLILLWNRSSTPKFKNQNVIFLNLWIGEFWDMSRTPRDCGKRTHIFLLSLFNEQSVPPWPLLLARYELWKHFSWIHLFPGKETQSGLREKVSLQVMINCLNWKLTL